MSAKKMPAWLQIHRHELPVDSTAKRANQLGAFTPTCIEDRGDYAGEKSCWRSIN
ncbi:hypothetical protein PY730_27920 (plasmid) [Klebsiella pneumoniae]|nr:hypothetical protein PY730_27920 [Klebsiella pneumoniae]